jgi:hypothetical protein
VVYASSSSALATGSALSFDGTNLGIGTSSPAYKLSVVKPSAGITARFTDGDGITDVYGYGVEITRSVAYIKGSSALHLGSAAGYSAVVLDSSGNLGLGVTPKTWSTGSTIELGSYFLKLSGSGTYGGVVTNNAYYNSGWKYAEANFANMYQTTSGEHRWLNAPSGGASGNTISFTQAMTLDASGNLLVGTTTAVEKLTVAGGVKISGQTGNADVEGVLIDYQSSASSGRFFAYNSGGSNMRFFTNASGGSVTERARITADGRVGIGSTAPDSLLEILTPSSHTANVLIARTQNSTTYTSSVATLICDRGTTNSTYNLLNCYNNGTGNQLVVRDSGNVQNTNNSYGAISDVKLKENIVDASPKLADLMQVKVRSYNLKSDSTHKQLGVIAQELETVFPAMVEEAIDRDLEGNDLGTTSKSVKYSVFVPMLIKAMQEQQAIIESLKARLDAANL